MIFYTLTSAGHWGRCWNPSLKGDGVSTRPERPADVNYQKSIYIWSLLLHKKHFIAQIIWRNSFKKLFFPLPLMARKSTLPANVLKTPLPGQRLTPSLLCTLLMMASVFMTAPECLFVKPQRRALTARELPCQYNVQVYAPDKTWLLIACGTAFYAKKRFEVFVWLLCRRPEVTCPFRWHDRIIWATSWENLFMPYANNKGADQPAHLSSLISAFVSHCLDSIIPLVSISNISRL